MQRQHQGYVNPDDLWYDGSDLTTFIYVNGQMFYGKVTHPELLRNQYDEIMDAADGLNANIPDVSDFSDQYSLYDCYLKVLERLEAHALTGRVGTLRYEDYVAFWQVDKKLYDAYLIDCLHELIDDRVISEVTILSTPFRTAPVYEILDDQDAGEDISADQIQQVELARKLHLLRGAEKKDAMKKLGLAQGSKKNPWQKELEKAGLNPGHKWWAMQSESLEQRLDEALSDTPRVAIRMAKKLDAQFVEVPDDLRTAIGADAALMLSNSSFGTSCSESGDILFGSIGAGANKLGVAPHTEIYYHIPSGTWAFRLSLKQIGRSGRRGAGIRRNNRLILPIKFANELQQRALTVAYAGDITANDMDWRPNEVAPEDYYT